MGTETEAESKPVGFDRRRIYRPFLDRLADRDLIVPRTRDAAQPPIHEAFADSAELSPGTQMALVGGIGSGKTTELLLTHKRVGRHSDAISIFVDLSEYTALNEINAGAILATAGLELMPT